MKRLLFLLTLALVAIPMWVIYSDELRFGSMGAHPYNQTQIEIMKDTLGFNIYGSHPGDCDDTDPYANAGIDPLALGGVITDEWVLLATYYNYAFIEAEDRGNQMDLYARGGDELDGYWVSDYEADTLFGPNNNLPGDSGSHKNHIAWERWYRDDRVYSGPDSLINYSILVKANIDTQGNPNDIVAKLGMAYNTWGNVPDTIHPVDSLRADAFPSDGSDGIFTFENIILPESTRVVNSTGSFYLKNINGYGAALIFMTTGARQVSVDWVKIYDADGQRLVETNAFEGLIADHCRYFESCEDSFWGFYTRDEPYALQFRPAGRVLEIIHGLGYDNWNIFTPSMQNHATEYWFDMVDNGFIALDFYPFVYSRDHSDSTHYTGYIAEESRSSLAIQSSLYNCGNWYKEYAVPARAVGKEFWVLPQAFGGDDGDGRSYVYLDLAPQVPDSIIASVDSLRVTLVWHMNPEADFNHYQIFKDTSAGFEPSIFNMQAEPETAYYQDSNINQETAYYYKLTSVDNQGNISDYSEEAAVIPTYVRGFFDDGLPRQAVISCAYPNPSNSNITIVYSASNLGPQPPRVELKIYDIQGRVVKTLVDDRIPAGTYRAVWDGTNDQSEPVASGTYIAKVSQWGSKSDFPMKITLLK